MCRQILTASVVSVNINSGVAQVRTAPSALRKKKSTQFLHSTLDSKTQASDLTAAQKAGFSVMLQEATDARLMLHKHIK